MVSADCESGSLETLTDGQDGNLASVSESEALADVILQVLI